MASGNESALLLMTMNREIVETLERTVKQAVREAVVLATADIEAAVLGRMKYPKLQVMVNDLDQSTTLLVTFPEPPHGR